MYTMSTTDHQNIQHFFDLHDPYVVGSYSHH